MSTHPHLQVRKRIINLFLIFFLMVTGLALRLIWIQVVNSEEYQNRAIEQRTRALKVEPKRGIIHDREGQELAVSASSETVVAQPMEIDDPARTARLLSGVLKISYDDIYKRITRRASAVYVERKVSEDVARAVREMNLPGITFTEESKRFYPKGNLASHILGFAGIDSQGLDGIELSYDKYLRGTPGKIEAESDAAGRSIPDGIQEYVAPQNGYNLYLTIDETIQYIVERELDKAMNEFQVTGGTVIVMDPVTGGILAMANRPDYNPNSFAEYPQSLWRNRGISDGFEPGSTFKIITTAAALEEGVVNENDRFVDPGYIKVSGETINCWKHGGHGSQTFAEVVQNSCNPGFVQVGMRVGKESFYNYIKAFGFGDESGIKLPGEANGIVSKYDAIGPVELATMSFGHGINVTPIQLTTAVSAVANGGMLLQPRLVQEIRTPDGELIEEIEPVRIRQVVSEDTAQRTLNLLEGVVEEGSGANAKIEGYRIGGKTGTAKHYGAEVYDASFIGILPLDNPQLVISVVLYGVTGYPYYGSQTAAPMFRRITYDTLRYLDIPPQLNEQDTISEINKVNVPNLTNADIFKAENILRNNGLDVKIIGELNNVVRQVPLSGAEVLTGTTVLLFTEDVENVNYLIAVPDLKGLTIEMAGNLLSQLGLEMESTGSGRIVDQEIKPGERVPAGTVLQVELKEDG
ncbi:MAG: stage V sporulation protein D [Halanaerobiales bacterium]